MISRDAKLLHVDNEDSAQTARRADIGVFNVAISDDTFCHVAARFVFVKLINFVYMTLEFIEASEYASAF